MGKAAAFAIVEDLQKIQAGICPGCGGELPPLPNRPHAFTCSTTCHRAWLDRIVARYGETTEITYRDPAGDVVYLVPTRVILEQGITAQDLRRYPKKDTPAITCPRCRRTSYNPTDIRERYCGACHRFLDDEGV